MKSELIPHDLRPAYNHAKYVGFAATALTGNSIAALIERIATLTAALKMALPYANGDYEARGEKWCEMIGKVAEALAGKGNADGN